MALAKLSPNIVFIRGRCGGVYFRHDRLGQHISAMPRSVRKANMIEPVLYSMSPERSRAANISMFSGVSCIWLLALLAFFAAAWGAFAAYEYFTTKKGERKKISGFNWYIHYAMMFPETERPPFWQPPHSQGELPNYIVTYQGHWTYEHTPLEWPVDCASGYYWEGIEHNGQPSYHTDDFKWFIWWSGYTWIVSQGLDYIDPPTTFYSDGIMICDYYRNPTTGKYCHVYIGKPAD